MAFTPSVSERRLLTMLVETPMAVSLVDRIGLTAALDKALIHNYVAIVDGVASVTTVGHTAMKRPHVTQKKVSNLLVASKAALDFIQLVDAPKPDGLVSALAAAIADFENAV